MAILTNSRSTFSAVGIRDDLSNIIYNISPMDTPFLSSAGRGTCDNTLFEWQTDELATQAANQQLQGDVPDALAVAETVMAQNQTQISFKTVATTGTAEAVDFAGRRSSQAYQMAKRAKEIKRDMEFMLTGNSIRVVGNTTTAPKTACVQSWLGAKTTATSNLIDAGNGTGVGVVNVDASNYANGTAVKTGTAPAKTLTQAHIDLVVQRCYEAGGSPDTMFCKPDLKVKLSALAGASIAELRTVTKGDKQAHAVNAVDVVVTDFGTFKFVPNRFCDQGDIGIVYVMDWDYWSINYLRPFQTLNLAKTGDNVKQMMLAEYGLEAKNGRASGAIIRCTAT